MKDLVLIGIVLAVVLGVAGAAFFVPSSYEKSCETKGGHMVRTRHSMICAKLEIITP